MKTALSEFPPEFKGSEAQHVGLFSRAFL